MAATIFLLYFLATIAPDASFDRQIRWIIILIVLASSGSYLRPTGGEIAKARGRQRGSHSGARFVFYKVPRKSRLPTSTPLWRRIA